MAKEKELAKYTKKELREVIKEEIILKQLAIAAQQKKIAEARGIAKRLNYVERRLNRRHQRLTEDIEDLETIASENIKEKLEELKGKMDIYEKQTIIEANKNIPNELNKDKPDWETIMEEIKKAYQALHNLNILENQLIQLLGGKKSSTLTMIEKTWKKIFG